MPAIPRRSSMWPSTRPTTGTGVSTIEAHAERVLLSPALMHTTSASPPGHAPGDSEYRAALLALYPGRLTPAHVLDALATYERPGDAARPLRSLSPGCHPDASTPWNAAAMPSSKPTAVSPVTRASMSRAACFRNSVSFRRPPGPHQTGGPGTLSPHPGAAGPRVFRVPVCAMWR